MSELHTGIQRFLGFELSVDDDDFYSVLRLPIGESDPARIASSLKAAIDTLKRCRPPQADPQWEAVAKCVQQAKTILLDPTKKTQYDQQLLQSTTVGGKGTTATESGLPNDLQRFREVLPSGDPNLHFDLPNFIRDLAKSDSKEETHAERLSQLQALMQGATSSSAADRSTTSAAAMKPAKPIPKIQKPKRREPSTLSNLVLAVLMLGGVLLVASIGWYLLDRKKPDSVAQVVPTPEIRITQSAPKQVRERDLAKNRSVPQTETTSPSLPEVGTPPDEESAAAVRAMMEEARQQEMSNNDPNMPPTDAMNGDTPSTDVSNSDPKMTSPPPVVMSEDDRAKFRALMEKARGALPEQDFDTFRSSILEVESLPLDPDSKSKLGRLNQLGQLHEQFVLAMIEGMSSLRGGATINVGNSPVAIVEANKNRIVIRSGGKNEEYVPKNIPVGLALAIASLRLDKSHPVDVAARGVFCLLHPKKNSLSERQGREWIQEASTSDRISPDLLEAITDSY